ncbi:hypothetical protein PR048_027121 [Dryococelus australis]|uniref:Uncharacterized protein n=1 Tax=Dryococelus australis TaxID=614101 RepID=A0ABQ9GG60_9NEOP|nr:hypothetical protein PR048_027121 [Dryococelus australis]
MTIAFSSGAVNRHLVLETYGRSWMKQSSGGAAVAERLACFLPPRRAGLNPRPGHSRIYACGNRAGRCRWSADMYGRFSAEDIIRRSSELRAREAGADATMVRWFVNKGGAAVAERLDFSPPTKAKRGSTQDRWESCGTMPGGFLGGLPFFPPLEFQRFSILTSSHPHRLSRPRCSEPPKSLNSPQLCARATEEMSLVPQGLLKRQSEGSGKLVLLLEFRGSASAFRNNFLRFYRVCESLPFSGKIFFSSDDILPFALPHLLFAVCYRFQRNQAFTVPSTVTLRVGRFDTETTFTSILLHFLPLKRTGLDFLRESRPGFRKRESC